VKEFEFRKGGIVYSCGLPTEGVFVVRSGSVRLTFSDPFGNARIARFVWAGEVFGLDSILTERTRLFTAVSREFSELCFMTSTAFEELVRSDKNRLWRFALLLDGLAHHSDLQKVEISGGRVRERLRNAIARLVSSPTDPAHKAIGSIRQWELAQYIGVAEETVSRELRRFHRTHLEADSPTR